MGLKVSFPSVNQIISVMIALAIIKIVIGFLPGNIQSFFRI